MKKGLLIALVVIIIGLLAVIFGKPSDGEEVLQNDTPSVTKSTTDYRYDEYNQSDTTVTEAESVPEQTSETVIEPTTEATSIPAAERTVETTHNVTTTPNTKKEEETAKLETKSTTTATKREDAEFDYVLNTNTMKFHYPSCKSVKDIKDNNREDYHGTRDKVIDRGFSPCGRCKP